MNEVKTLKMIRSNVNGPKFEGGATSYLFVNGFQKTLSKTGSKDTHFGTF